MQFQIVRDWKSAPECDGIVCFMLAGQEICFPDPQLQSSYSAVYGADSFTVPENRIISRRFAVDGRYVTALVAGLAVIDAGLSSQAAADAGSPSETASDSRTFCMFPDNALLSSLDQMDRLRDLIAKLGTMMKEHGMQTVFLDGAEAVVKAGICASVPDVLVQIASVLPLCEYSFDQYKAVKSAYHNVTIYVHSRTASSATTPAPDDNAGAGSSAESEALREGAVLSRSIMIARDLVNDQAQSMTPAALAEKTKKLGDEFGFDVNIYDRAQCEAWQMGLFLAVARGSALEPRFIVMHYQGAESDAPVTALVGKGITYDSGGYRIKTSGMESMYMDMNGAAGVIGAMCAIAAQKLPVNVVAVVAACENMVDARAYRNGDVLTSMSGKTVYVQNTDAEGRLTMADAITYCVRYEHPAQIIEMAGLTGSVCSFYGDACAAAMPTRQYLYDRISELMPLTGEKFAQMPYFPKYLEKLKSPYADLTNAPTETPGISAALFLCSFSENIPMISIDTGMMPFSSRVWDGHPAGATGFGVKMLYYYMSRYSRTSTAVCEQ